ncbi:MAG: hypothetical protein K6A89_02115 [Treponema sp.]|nr:hypothetical protein [Treponema sp.]
MKKEILIIKKEEAYTYDELDFLEEKLLPLVEDIELKLSAGDFLRSLKESLENQKASSAVFFMPQETFNIFSLIQGDNSICKINKNSINALYKAFDFVDDFEKHPVYSHLKKKLQMLDDYLEQGNSVSPTVIAADNFSVMRNI